MNTLTVIVPFYNEISFLDKSVKTLNDDLVNDYATIKSAMVVLLGENLRGDTDGKIFELARDKADGSRVTASEDDIDDFKGSDEMSVTRQKIAANTEKPNMTQIETKIQDKIFEHYRSFHR